MLLAVPARPSALPNKSSTVLSRTTHAAAGLPPPLTFFCIARRYIIGGKTNIMLDPKIPPEIDPTTPMSLN